MTLLSYDLISIIFCMNLEYELLHGKAVVKRINTLQIKNHIHSIDLHLFGIETAEHNLVVDKVMF